MFIVGIFIIVGIFLIGLGIWLIARPYGRHGVEVDAECIQVSEEDVRTGIAPDDYTYYKDAKRPVYRYYYNGKCYTSSPMLQSNRPGYHPELGTCKIRINPDHPERVYSSERKAAAAILIFIGVLYLVLIGVLVFLPFFRMFM